MSYLAFYNKYRPQTFDQIVGQKAIVTTLKNAIKEDKIAHAYLFCGPRGTGKTSLARLFAKALNCFEGRGFQCNDCESCKKIIDGDDPDVIEIDAASNSTVDSVRQLIDTVSYQPIMSRYKIYIIDEVHSMSNSAFNALLKTLEEPPSFVIFILATTEPQKILPTILSRVQRFDFSKVSEKDLVKNMEYILKEEKIKYDIEALKILASLSDGGVRDSLSLLDQLVSYCSGDITCDDVNSLFGLLSLSEEISLVKMIQSRKADEILKFIRDKYEKGADILKLHNDLISIYKDLLVFATTNDVQLLERLKEKDIQGIYIDVIDLKNKLEILIKDKRDYRMATNLLSSFELTLLNLIKQVDIVTSSVETIKEKPIAVNPIEPIEVTAAPIKTDALKKQEDEQNVDLISYDDDDILLLMSNNKKEERKSISEIWSDLERYLEGKMSTYAKLLKNSKLRVATDGVLLVTNTSLEDVESLMRIDAQKEIQKLLELAFGKKYNLLCLKDETFFAVYTKFKDKVKPTKEKINIKFENEKDEGLASSFLKMLNTTEKEA